MFLAVAVFGQELAVIVNPSTDVSSLTRSKLKNIYLGKKSSWGDGSAINFSILNSGPVHTAFLKTYVKKSPSQFSTFWKKAVFTGTGTPPKQLNNEKAMLDFVANNPGAIGYIDKANINDSVKEINIK